MANKKIITVFGATGAQGGGVVDTFLNDPKLKSDWAVRAVTRDATKDSAKKLQSRGAEVVSADMNDKASLVKAMTGAAAVYAVTNYWEKMDAELEVKQGKDLVDAAKETGVQHFIWSSLFDINKLSNGKLPHVYHFDSKAHVEEYARQVGIPSTFFMPGFYMSNFPGGMFRQVPEQNNAWVLALPVSDSAKVPMFDAADTGKYVKAIVLHRDQLLGKRFLGATNYLTVAEIVDAFKKAFPEAGKTAGHFNVPHDMYIKILTGTGMPEFAAVELFENMRLLEEFGYYGGESLDESHKLIEDKLTTWEEFMMKAPAFQGLK